MRHKMDDKRNVKNPILMSIIFIQYYLVIESLIVIYAAKAPVSTHSFFRMVQKSSARECRT